MKGCCCCFFYHIKISNIFGSFIFFSFSVCLIPEVYDNKTRLVNSIKIQQQQQQQKKFNQKKRFFFFGWILFFMTPCPSPYTQTHTHNTSKTILTEVKCDMWFDWTDSKGRQKRLQSKNYFDLFIFLNYSNTVMCG